MKIDERIILYLDKQMGEEERRAFEKELRTSPELSKQLERGKKVLQNLKADEHSLQNEDYFLNLIPRFREKLSSNRKRFKIKIAYAVTSLAVVLVSAILWFNLFNTSNNNSFDNIISQLNESEAAQIFDYYSDNFASTNLNQLNGSSDSLFTELLTSELNLQESDLKSLVASDEINEENIYSEIQSAEAELIYNELLKTKFF